MIYAENRHAKRIRMEKDRPAKGVREVLPLGHRSVSLAKCSLRFDQQFF